MIFVGIYCVVGFLRGAIRQFFGIVTLIVVTALSIVVPSFVKLPGGDIVSPIVAHCVLVVLIWIPSYLVLHSVSKFILARILKEGVSTSDRLWGLSFGAIKGLIISLLIVFFVSLFPENIMQLFPVASKVYRESKFTTYTLPYNPLLKIHIIKNLKIVTTAIYDDEYREQLEKDKNYRAILNQKSIKPILEDQEIRQYIENKQIIKFISHEKTQALMKDTEAIKLLLNTQLDKKIEKSESL